MSRTLDKGIGEKRNASLKRTKSIAFTGVFVALISVCSWISIPTAIPFTLQTFAVNLALLLLGGKLGTLAILVYLLLGFAGVPVLANFSGGPGAFAGPTGGYLVGFLVLGLFYMFITSLSSHKSPGQIPLWLNIFAIAVSNITFYALGTAWFMVLYNAGDSTATMAEALAWCVLPFLPMDIAKIVLAFILQKILRKTGLFSDF